MNGAGTSPSTTAAPWVATALACVLSACAPNPPVEFTVELPADVADGRGRFNEIYCAVLQARGTEIPDYRPCAEALSRVAAAPPGTDRPVDLGASERGLVAGVVPGIGYACFREWLKPPGTIAAHVQLLGFDQIMIEVDALSGTLTNARQIRDAIMARPQEPGAPKLVLVGYSKGAPDILEAIVQYPEIHDRIAAVLSAGGAVGGSALAIDAKQQQADLLRHWPRAECEPGPTPSASRACYAAATKRSRRSTRATTAR